MGMYIRSDKSDFKSTNIHKPKRRIYYKSIFNNYVHTSSLGRYFEKIFKMFLSSSTARLHLGRQASKNEICKQIKVPLHNSQYIYTYGLKLLAR
jgi:hypothetical protein